MLGSSSILVWSGNVTLHIGLVVMLVIAVMAGGAD